MDYVLIVPYYTNIKGKSHLKQNIFFCRLVKPTTVRRLSVKFHGAASINRVCTVNNGATASLLLAMFTLSYLINSAIARSSHHISSNWGQIFPIFYRIFLSYNCKKQQQHETQLFEKYPSYIQVRYFVSFTFRY